MDTFPESTYLHNSTLYSKVLQKSSDSQRNIEITVSYQGLKLTLSSSELENGFVEKKITYTYTDFYKAVQYTEPAPVAPSAVEGAEWTFVEGTKYDKYVKDGVYAEEADKAEIGEYILKIDETELAKVPYLVTISAPTFEVSLTGAETDKWYNTVDDPITITVTAEAEAVLKGYDNGVLPKIEAKDATVGEWTTADSKVFTNTVTVEKTTTVTAGDKSLEVKVDNKTPEISNVDSYIKGENTVIKFEAKTGESGIGSVQINGKAVAFTQKEKQIEVLHNEKLADQFEIAVTSNAKLTGTVGKNSALGELGVTIKEPENTIGTRDGVTYISGDAVFTITVDNAHGEFEAAACDLEGNPVDVAWEANKGSFKLAAGASLNGLKVSVKDDTGRTAEASFETQYKVDNTAPEITVKVDNTAPEITVTGLETEEKTYINEQQEYSVAIEEDAILGDDYSAFYYLDGQTEGTKIELSKDGETAKGSFKLTDGMYLKKIVVTATNATGIDAEEKVFTDVEVDQTKPVINATVSATDASHNKVTVSHFYKNQNTWFAVLDPVETNSTNGTNGTNGTVTLTVTYTLNEKNPDSDALMADGWTCTDNVWTKVISKEIKDNETLAIDISVEAKDLASNLPEADIKICGASGENDKIILLTATDGKYSGSIAVDRRTPSTEADANKDPSVTLKPTATATADVGGKPLYNKNFAYELTVTDVSVNGADSGVERVKWYISEDTKGFLTCEGEVTEITNPVKIDVTANGENEINGISLVVTVTDKVGNQFMHIETFSFDNLAPRVTVKYEDAGSCGNECYFNATRTATITYEDRNLKVMQYTKDGVKADATVEQKVEFTADGHHTLSVLAQDLANNETSTFKSESLAPEDFYIDTKNPVVTIERTTRATYTGTDEENNVEYYNDVVTYTVRAEDEYMDKGVAWVKYELIDEDGIATEMDVNLLAQENRETVIEIKNGEALAMLQVYACDNAGWIKKDQLNSMIAVDMTPAKVIMTKELAEDADCVRTMGGVDYYDHVVTYALTITDRYQMNISDVEVVVDYNGAQEDAVITLDDVTRDTGDTFANANVSYTTSFTVEDGSDIQAMSILVKDNAGNITKEIDFSSATLTTFEYDSEEEKNVYTGNRVVVDTTAPVVAVSFSDNVKAVYTNESQPGVIYVELNEPTNGDSGVKVLKEKETVELTVEITDLNIARLETESDDNFQGSVEVTGGNGVLSGETAINERSSIEYKQSIDVNVDETGAFAFELSVFDLANNPFVGTENNQLEVEVGSNQEENDSSVAKIDVIDGKFGATISVDRRRPTSGVDTDVPEISITAKDLTSDANVIDPVKASNDKELYSEAFEFALTVTDGELNTTNSGIRMVSWTIDDSVGFVQNADVEKPQKKGTYTQDFAIPVEVNGLGESNDVTLTITAIDNVGNKITYKKEFAVDNLAPRINVTYNNNDVRNEKYFKAARESIITVEDINFNIEATEIATQVTPTQWVQSEENAAVWTCSCDYADEGVYTFAMRSTDLAGNLTADLLLEGETADATVDYGTSEAPTDFVIDMTAPKLEVFFNPASAVGRDDEGVEYYAQEVNVTVQIEEVNFDQTVDFNATFNDNQNRLSGFNEQGSNVHVASAHFGEGNRYQFAVQYTDLAGNEANPYSSPTFSVDLTAPTVEITEGTMTNDKLNIVQNDMVLGFTINDAQSNLKNYVVTVNHLNNEFKSEVVTGADYYSTTAVDGRTEVRVDFANIAKDKGNDGIYTVQILAEDYANNQVELTPELLFSLNRFGSTFYTEDPFTQEFLMPSEDGAVYQQLVGQKLIFNEVNPNRVWQDSEQTADGSVLTVAVNGTTRILEEGVDYKVSVDQMGTGSTKWYVYTYEVDPAIFADGAGTVDGRYTLLFYSEDEAGNKNTNESNEFGMIQLGLNGEYSGKVEFTLDDTTPIISTVGIETNGSYDAENQPLRIFLSDNTPVSIAVTLNGTLIELAEAAGASNAAWLVWNEAEGCYVLNVPEQNTLFGRQTVGIKVTDAAGNVAESEITDFTVSSNLFVRFVNSIWFWIVCAALVLLILLAVFLFKKKQRSAAAA